MKITSIIIGLIASIVSIAGFILGLPESVPRVKAFVKNDNFFDYREEQRKKIVDKLFESKIYTTTKSIRYQLFLDPKEKSTVVINRIVEKKLKNVGEKSDAYIFESTFDSKNETGILEIKINGKSQDLKNCNPKFVSETNETSYACPPEKMAPGDTLTISSKYIMTKKNLCHLYYADPDVNRELVLEETSLIVEGDPTLVASLKINVSSLFPEKLLNSDHSDRTWKVTDYLLPFQGFFVQITNDKKCIAN
jgi:hypothetical protein